MANIIIICPRCGTTTGFFPEHITGKGRLVNSSSEHRDIWDHVSIAAVTLGKAGQTNYAILVCLACGKRFVAEKILDEWRAVSPIPGIQVADEIPELIRSEFAEAKLCLAVGAYRGCLLICRTALIDLQREQGVSSLKELNENGVISNLLYGQADEIRLWANVIAHEVVLPEAIEEDDIEELMLYLQTVLETVYVQPKRLSNLVTKRKSMKKGAVPDTPPLA